MSDERIETDTEQRREALKKIAVFAAYTAPAAMILMKSRKAQAQSAEVPPPPPP